MTQNYKPEIFRIAYYFKVLSQLLYAYGIKFTNELERTWQTGSDVEFDGLGWYVWQFGQIQPSSKHGVNQPALLVAGVVVQEDIFLLVSIVLGQVGVNDVIKMAEFE